MSYPQPTVGGSAPGQAPNVGFFLRTLPHPRLQTPRPDFDFKCSQRETGDKTVWNKAYPSAGYFLGPAMPMTNTVFPKAMEAVSHGQR